MTAWSYTDADRDFVARHVKPYLPDKIFDAHAHLFCHTHYLPDKLPAHLIGTPTAIGLAIYREHMEWLHPGGRTSGGLFFGLAFQGDRKGNDDYVAAEVKTGQATGFHAFGQMLIAPEMEPDYVRETVRRHGFVGLKPYHLMAQVEGPTFLAPIEAYLSEAHMRLAHEEGLTITLHMVLDRAMADPRNQATIRRYCEQYPNMRLILAHAARGFNPWHTIEGIGSLRGLSNVWCDTSAVTPQPSALRHRLSCQPHARPLHCHWRFVPLALRRRDGTRREAHHLATRLDRPGVATQPLSGAAPAQAD
jgi:hypothetical protein